MKIKKIQKRTNKVDSIKVENEFLTFSFSSEYAVERYFGKEILSHKKGAMNLSRLKNKAPVLFNHDHDVMLGVVEDAWVGDDLRGYCKVKMSRNDFAQDKRKDIEDGILVNVSFGYEIERMELLSEEKDKAPEYLITSFTPFEISFVSIPADPTVGLGRAMNESEEEEIEVIHKKKSERTNDSDEYSEDEDERSKKITLIEKQILTNSSERNFTMEMKDVQQQERERIQSINKLVQAHGERDLGDKFIQDGKTAAEFALYLVDKLGGTRDKINDKPLDLTSKEQKNYSIVRAINAIVNKNWDKAGFEKECSDVISKQYGRGTEGFYMPGNIQLRAPYATSASATGGATVQTSILGDQFIDVLRNRTKVVAAGAQVLSGLVGNVSIPRKNGRSQVYWISELGTITESEATFDQVSFSPKTAVALSSVSKQLLAQSSLSVDAMITDDLNKEIALGVDGASLYGTGAAGQPKGVINQSGVNSISLGTNGGALNFDALIDMETAAAAANADVETMSYMTNAKQIGVLKKIKDSTGAYLWSNYNNGSPAGFPAPRASAVGVINGYDTYRTNQIPGNLTKGTGTNLSAVVFADWSQLVIAQWMAGVEILVNPYGPSFAKGGVDIRAMTMVDVNLKIAAAFSVVSDAI